MLSRPLVTVLSVVAVASMVAGCASRSSTERENRGFFGGLLGSGPRATAPDAGIGVNAFLWRASLDTLSFMPLEQIDPFGGVIITDWYANPEAPEERFKATVYVLDSRLRADALSVQLFRQARNPSTGDWTDVVVDQGTRIQVENAILTRARQMRISQLPGS
ncbi:DUF3576 domain-containing protein [Glycocaulis alkaliphilus]|uniref:DUF3576 domain-containing protein n=1 Tax=Glycocaulis alkaliphilus TaxID=1434191 RepID=UPI000FD95D5B|nr:DUF3576 domain-containing protein [Glycocaulis alkaliphilus]GGB80142.1 hypothetical protein GCM10007417_20110 [Glycocaulis alkaliphilus]